MKRLLVPLVALAVLVLPAGAAGYPNGPGDGTLTVRDASGRVVVAATGGFIGRFDRGSIRIVDPEPDDLAEPIVTGGVRERVINERTSVYMGANVRFRLVGGKFRIAIHAKGIDLSVVGRGSAVLDGQGGRDGRFSFNGEPYRSLPDFPEPFQLGAAPAAP